MTSEFTNGAPWVPTRGDWVRDKRDGRVHRVVAWLPHAGPAGRALINWCHSPVRLDIDEIEPCASPEEETELQAIGAELERLRAIEEAARRLCRARTPGYHDALEEFSAEEALRKLLDQEDK